MKKLILLLFLFLSVVGISKLSAAESSPQFIQGTDTLVVYSDVPGLTPSDKYTIRVRSAATNNEWVDVFVNYTYNRAFELADIPGNDGVNPAGLVQSYNTFTNRWSHSYGNIEMNNNQAVEVEIAAKDTSKFKIGGKNFFKATVHPAQKASAATVVDGKVYFTISKPAQIVIDINGQMDDYNAAVNPIGHPVHAISLFSNPVIKKPTLNGSRVLSIEPGTSLATINAISPSSYDTMYFKPGVHDIGRGMNLHPGKAIYIPGDALIYGTMSNELTAKPGRNISIYGYGTISGAKITHYLYTYYYPNESTLGSPKPIVITNGENFRVHGVCIVDPANHSKSTDGSGGYCAWLKTISWRANGDGFGGWERHDDCFIRSNDDASYAKGHKARCTFWKDSNSALFHLASIPEGSGNTSPSNPIIIEDCDILYARGKNNGDTHVGGFWQRGEGTPGVRNVNVIFRNFRIHDTRIGMSIFYLDAETDGSSYNGLIFQNISMPATTIKQRMYGAATAPWDGGIIFDNITIGGVLLTQQNFSTYFVSNEFVKNILFRMPAYYTISKSTNATEGTITINPNTATYIENSKVMVTAMPNPGYVFEGWSGDASGTTNPLEITMNGNKNISATFKTFGDKTIIINYGDVGQTAGVGVWTCPSGVASMIVECWGGGGAGGSIQSVLGGVSTKINVKGGGGAGGSYAQTQFNSPVAGDYAFSIGAGGIGAASGFTDGAFVNGNSTTFYAPSNVIAVGGNGGESKRVTTADLTIGAAGAKQSSGNSGTITTYGGAGGIGTVSTNPAGGGSAGAGGAGGDAINNIPGAAGLVGGVIGAATSTSTYNNGIAGGNPGAGGSGANGTPANPGTTDNYRKGGNGGNGRIVITYSISTQLTETKANVYLTVVGKSLLLKGDVYAVEVYNAQGVLIQSQTKVTRVDSLTTGIYIVKMHTPQGVNVQKVIIL